MENYIKLNEYMTDGQDVRIEKHKKNPLPGILLLVAGIAVLIAGTQCKMTDSAQMALIAIGALAALTGGFLLVMLAVSSCGGFRYKKTGACMKHYRRYINADDRTKMLECIRNAEMKQMSQVRKETSTGTLLNAYISSDGKFAVVQAEEYIPHDFVPMTPAVCLEGNEAQTLLNWVKS